MQIMREAMRSLDKADQFEELSVEYAIVRVVFRAGVRRQGGTMTGYAGGLSADRTRFHIDHIDTCQPQFTMVPLVEVDHFEVIERTGTGTMFVAA